MRCWCMCDGFLASSSEREKGVGRISEIYCYYYKDLFSFASVQNISTMGS